MSRPTGSRSRLKTRGASGFIASRSSEVNGRSRYSTLTRRAASRATSGETAATAATSCPAKRTTRESVVQTAFTPGSASAREVSIDRISAAGTEAPTMRPYSMPGSLMSNVYFAFPVTLSGPSNRGRGRPICSNPGTLSRSQGLMSVAGGWTSSACGEPGRPALAVNVEVGSFGCCGTFTSSCAWDAAWTASKMRP